MLAHLVRETRKGRFSRAGSKNRAASAENARGRARKSAPTTSTCYAESETDSDSAVVCESKLIPGPWEGDHTYAEEPGPDHTVPFVAQTISEPRDEATSGNVVMWNDGRRIVSLGILADGLKQCQLCSQPGLQLANTISERRYGLGSILYIRCTWCGLINEVHTGKQTNKSWDINCKAAAGMLNAGMGESQLNNLLAVMNIPGISRKTLKKREREVGGKIEDLAADSCATALQEEIDQTRTKSDDGITVSFDGAWQKRGSGSVQQFNRFDYR